MHDPTKKGVQSSKGSAKQGKGPDEGGSAPMCALCAIDRVSGTRKAASGGSIALDHATKSRGGDVACPAMIISVVDAGMSEDEILADTNTYVTPLVLPVSALREVLRAKTAALARSVVRDDELRDINMNDPDEVEELGKVMLIVAFEQVSRQAGIDVSLGRG